MQNSKWHKCHLILNYEKEVATASYGLVCHGQSCGPPIGVDMVSGVIPHVLKYVDVHRLLIIHHEM